MEIVIQADGNGFFTSSLASAADRMADFGVEPVAAFGRGVGPDIVVIGWSVGQVDRTERERSR